MKFPAALMTGFVLLAAGSPAAIPIGAGGYSESFTSLPPASSWATFNPGGGSSDIGNAAGLDAYVQTLAASSFINTLLVATNWPTITITNQARWNTNGQCLQTMPTGVKATVLLATLQNISGTNATGLNVSYLFGQQIAGALGEQVAGHRAYYSLSGAAGSWVVIPTFCTGSTGSLSATLNFPFAWANNALLYLLWADDNATSTEGGYTLDNFSAAPIHGLAVNISSPANGAAVASPATVALAAAVTGTNIAASVQFFQNGLPVGTDSSAPFGMTLSNLTAGAYAIHAVATDNTGLSATSAVSTLVITNVYVLRAWPGETWQNATNLTGLDANFNVNMSGGFWNPVTRSFWICRNGGPSAFWEMVDNGQGSLRVATNAAGVAAKFVVADGDLEAICQPNLHERVVYLLAETQHQIRKYDVTNNGTAVLLRTWDITPFVPAYDGTLGPEGLAFIPDEWLLREKFLDGNGLPRCSSNGMGGLMFVSHQNGGRIYALDVNPTNSTVNLVGTYRTSRTDSSDLNFDLSTGLLYIWHNTSTPNYLEVVELSSFVLGGERTLLHVGEFLGPKNGNLEGIAIVSTPETNNWIVILDDDNQDGAAVTFYHAFDPSPDLDQDGLADAWELQYFGTTLRSSGSGDQDHDGITEAQEFTAGTNPTNSSSFLRIVSTTREGGDIRIAWTTGPGRTYQVVGSTNVTFATGQTVIGGDVLFSGSGESVTNAVLTGGATNAGTFFYRVRIKP